MTSTMAGMNSNAMGSVVNTRSNMPSVTASPEQESRYKKTIEKVTRERDQALAENERLEKEAVAHKYTVQSLKDKITEVEK